MLTHQVERFCVLFSEAMILIIENSHGACGSGLSLHETFSKVMHLDNSSANKSGYWHSTLKLEVNDEQLKNLPQFLGSGNMSSLWTGQ